MDKLIVKCPSCKNKAFVHFSVGAEMPVWLKNWINKKVSSIVGYIFAIYGFVKK